MKGGYKGKGKGFKGKGFPSKGFGKGYGKNSKGKGKGSAGKGPTIFRGDCYTCGKGGHSAKNCWQIAGKGFNGECNNCKTWGHRASECPKGVNEVGSPEESNENGRMSLGGGLNNQEENQDKSKEESQKGQVNYIVTHIHD